MSGIRRERGQITVFFALVAIPIGLGIAYLFNSADLFSRKIRVQDGADAAALAQATWTARSMNAMAHNNVALTQTEVVDSLASTVALTVGELQVELARQLVIAIEKASACWAFPPTCVEPLLRLAAIYAAQNKLVPLEELVAALPEFAKHAAQYGRANDRIFTNFPAFSAAMQRSLATTNGLPTAPRMQMVGFTKQPWLSAPQYASTGLPASRVDSEGVVDDRKSPDNLTTIWLLTRSVNATGWHGTRRQPFPQAHNFLEHGYERDKGPYEPSRDDVKDRLEDVIRLVDALNLGRWSPKVGEREPKYDRCWDIATTVPFVPLLCKNGVPAGTVIPPLYAPAMAPKLDSDVLAFGVTDVLVLQSSAKAEHTVAASRFPNALPAAYAFAKARVYSATAPDLYSSDWRAALVPVLSWTRGSTDLPKELRTSMNNLTKSDTTLNLAIRNLNDAELQRVLLH